MDNHYFIGIDIGGTNVDALIVDHQLQTQGFLTTPIRSKSGQSSIAVIIEIVGNLLSQAGISDFSQIAAIGVGVPGLVDAFTGQVELAVNLDQTSMPLGALLETHFGRPVFVENDANAVALGASKFLVDSSVKNLAFITIGTGVGAGLVLNGNIFHGSRNMAGEIGHMFVQESDIRCQCGNYGCLETFVAGPAIARMAQTAYLQNPATTSLVDLQKLEAEDVFKAADQNDPIALEIVAAVGLVLARAIQGMVMSFDLEKIIIGGGVSRAGETLLRPILKEWAKMCSDSAMASEVLLPERLMLCPADYKAGAWGAVAIALDRSSNNASSTNVFQKEPMVLSR
ncbi:MAG: glucokinase [Cellvibrionaceae bacterium]|jgi:glucokinase